MARKILVVDHDADTAQRLALLLKRLGYSTRYTADPAAVLGIATRQRPFVVLLDLAISGLDPVTLAGQLKRAFPEVCVVAVSGQKPPRGGRRGAGAAFDAYLDKPVEENALQSMLEKLFEDRRSITDRAKTPDAD